MVVDDRLFVQLPLAISSVPVRQTGGEHWASEFLFSLASPKALPPADYQGRLVSGLAGVLWHTMMSLRRWQLYSDTNCDGL